MVKLLKEILLYLVILKTMSKKTCKHINIHTEKDHGLQYFYDGIFKVQLTNKPTITSYCADCGNKLKTIEVNETNSKRSL